MTMQRARRLASVVVVASLGVAGLSACQSAPSVAAYVGSSERISQDRVDAVYNEVRDKLQAASSKPVTPPITRTDVVSVLVGSEMIDKIAAQQGVSAPADLQVPALAQALKLPADSEYVKLYAEWEGVVSALRSKVTTPATPTDADLHELFDSLIDAQQADPSTKFTDFKSQLAQSQNMAIVQQTVAVRNEIEKASAQFGIRVNPRYQPAQLPVLETQDQNTGQLIPLMNAPVGPNDLVAPVTDAR
jgi:hypothetical protein